MKRKHAMTGAALALVMIMGGAANAASITPPSEAFAQTPGSDYFLADYTAYEAYLKTLASQSDRMKLVDIGKSEEGRTQWVAIVSSPANLANAGLFDAGLVGRLVEKCRAGNAIGFADNMAFVTVLSTQLLHDQFCHRDRPGRGAALT